jgi:urea transporter
MISRAQASLRFVLQLYAGCVFSASPWTGALLLLATALSPYTALLGLAAVASALYTAHALHLLSAKNPPAVYSYSALFLGLMAARTFADPWVAAMFALLGAATSALMTASLRELGQRFELPALSLPFITVYSCALGTGHVLGVRWAAPPPASHELASYLPAPARLYLEGLGAIACDGRVEVGILVLAAILAAGLRTTLLTMLGALAALSVSQLLTLTPALQLMATVNAVFTALAIGARLYPTSLGSYGLVALGATFCSLCTPSLAAPLGRLALTPLSLPFNLSFFTWLLLTRQRAPRETLDLPVRTPTHSVISQQTLQ